MHGADNYATFLLALSGSARSNGVLSVGYICFWAMHQAYGAYFTRKRACVSNLCNSFTAELRKSKPGNFQLCVLQSFHTCKYAYRALSQNPNISFAPQSYIAHIN